jgi:hypothetical protein
MAPSTPRRPQKQRNHPSGGAAGRRRNNAPALPSDYESDAFDPESAAQPPVIPPQPAAPQGEGVKSIEGINLTVLQRYVPTIKNYTAMAHNATLFTWKAETESWDETGVKGPFFICNQEPQSSPTGQPIPQGCAFILNRSSPENAVFDLATIAQCELSEGQLLSAMTDTGQVWAFFMDVERAQETWKAFRNLWLTVRAGKQG